MTTGERQRAVAIINLMVGVVIGMILVGAVVVSQTGQFALAIGAFSGCLLLLVYRIHRVFQVID